MSQYLFQRGVCQHLFQRQSESKQFFSYQTVPVEFSSNWIDDLWVGVDRYHRVSRFLDIQKWGLQTCAGMGSGQSCHYYFGLGHWKRGEILVVQKLMGPQVRFFLASGVWLWLCIAMLFFLTTMYNVLMGCFLFKFLLYFFYFHCRCTCTCIVLVVGGWMGLWK